MNSGAADSPLPMPTGGGGGDAAPADSGADASVRLAGRTARTRQTDFMLSLASHSTVFLLFNSRRERVYPSLCCELQKLGCVLFVGFYFHLSMYMFLQKK